METFRLQLTTRSSDETRALGEALGRLVNRGLVIALGGPLGGGKTRFVQGLARGLEVVQPPWVTSPTYTLIHVHQGRRPLYHADVYRLEAADLEGVGFYDLLDGVGVLAVEWAERIAGELPEERLEVTLAPLEGDARRVALAAYGLDAVLLLRELEKIARGPTWV
jgi:tRNA threonylcarbamoyladenosine biosynthesis protein TsaE